MVRHGSGARHELLANRGLGRGAGHRSDRYRPYGRTGGKNDGACASRPDPAGRTPIIWGVLRSDPRDHGLSPDGESLNGRPAAPQPKEIRWRGRDALRSRNFLALATAFGAILLCQTGLAVHHVHLLREHMGVWEAGLGAATLPVGSIFGRLVAGWLADRIDKRWVAAGLFATQALALGCLARATGPTTMLAASVLFGLTVGAVFMMQSLLVADLFGLASFGTVLGMLNS